MREILFRGKAKYNGEWVYGGISEIDGHFYIVQMIKYCPDTRDWDLANYYEENPQIKANWLEVDPATVGQYTGLKDKNGRRIFEGDILRGFRYRDHGQWGENETCTYTVKWDDKKSAFYPLYFFDGYTFDINTYEVIGNIYENPELLDTAEA